MIELSWLLVLKFWLYDANLCRSQNYLGTIWRPGVYFSLNIDGVILGPMVGWDFQDSNSDFKYLLIVETGNHLFSTCLASFTFDLYMLRIGAREEDYLQLYCICIYIMKKCITAWGFYCTYMLSSLRKEWNIILSSDFTAAVEILTIHLIILTVQVHSLISGCCWGLQFIFGVLQFYCD